MLIVIFVDFVCLLVCCLILLFTVVGLYYGLVVLSELFVSGCVSWCFWVGVYCCELFICYCFCGLFAISFLFACVWVFVFECVWVVDFGWLLFRYVFNGLIGLLDCCGLLMFVVLFVLTCLFVGCFCLFVWLLIRFCGWFLVVGLFMYYLLLRWLAFGLVYDCFLVWW